MCRYASDSYRSHFVCVPCRLVRKEWRRSHPDPAVRCSRCHAEMIDAGFDFHAPKAADDRQWRKLELLFADGTRFHSCGCNGPGHVPASLSVVRAALAARADREAVQDPIRASQRINGERRYGRTPTFGARRRTAA